MPRMLICDRLDTTDSTQREVLRRLSGVGASDHRDKPPQPELGLARPFGLWTTRQTQGIASHGRRWQDSPDGGLALSIAWPEQQAQASDMAWPIRWSLLVISALETSYPELRSLLGVKWPNDVMAQQAKLAGILVSRHLVGGQWWCVAGVGINLAWGVLPEIGRPVTDLRRLGVANPDPEQIVMAIAQAATDDLSVAQTIATADVYQSEYRRRDVAVDAIVSVVHPVTGATLMTGTNQGINTRGELMLQVDGQQQTVAIGELSLRFAPDVAAVST